MTSALSAARPQASVERFEAGQSKKGEWVQPDGAPWHERT